MLLIYDYYLWFMKYLGSSKAFFRIFCLNIVTDELRNVSLFHYIMLIIGCSNKLIISYWTSRFWDFSSLLLCATVDWPVVRMLSSLGPVRRDNLRWERTYPPRRRWPREEILLGGSAHWPSSGRTIFRIDGHLHRFVTPRCSERKIWAGYASPIIHCPNRKVQWCQTLGILNFY